LGLEVHVVTVIHPVDAVGPDAVLDAIVGRLESQGLRAHRSVLRSTYVAGAIADFSESIDADIVAMCSHTRVGTARVALGSVTMGVVGMAHCPVLVDRIA
jgi:nucleotide-binding universal stress UspA family protein